VQLDNRFYFQRIELLQEPYDLHMFEHYAGSQQLPAELQKLQQDIVRHCGGMPLALRLVAAKLRRTREEDEWKVCN
jgi:hypothetical protein